MLAALKGTAEEKRTLFDELIEKANSDEGLDSGELVILETLKKELLKPKSIIVQMGAGLKGVGGVKL